MKKHNQGIIKILLVSISTFVLTVGFGCGGPLKSNKDLIKPGPSEATSTEDEIPKTLITKDVDKLRLVLLSGIYDALFTKLQTTNNATKEQVVRILIDLGITESKDVKSISSSLGKLIKGDTKKETSQIISKLRNLTKKI